MGFARDFLLSLLFVIIDPLGMFHSPHPQNEIPPKSRDKKELSMVEIY